MNDVQPERPVAGRRTRPIFEQPLNERLRTFLRLDFLYSQALYHNDKASSWGSRAAMASLLDMLAIATRSDVRSEVLKELERHLAKLHEYQNHPGIDAARLRALMSNLVRLRADLGRRARPGCSRCAIRNSWRPSSIAAPFPAAPANSTCRTITSGSTSPTRCAWPPSCAGRDCCGRCAMRSPKCCG